MDEIGLFTVKEGKITREGSSTRRAEIFFGPLQRRRRRQRLRNLRQAWHWRTRGQMGAPQTSPACWCVARCNRQRKHGGRSGNVARVSSTVRAPVGEAWTALFSPLTAKPDEPGKYHTVSIELSERPDRTPVTLSQDNNATAEEREHFSVSPSGLDC